MINELRYSDATRLGEAARAYQQSQVIGRPTAEAQVVRGGILGTALGALTVGGLFPLMVGAVSGGLSFGAIDLAVYSACGVIAGAVGGGSLGVVLSGRGSRS